MRTVTVYAASLKAGDVLDGQRILAVHKYGRRCRSQGSVHKLAHTGVLLVAPNPNGHRLDTFDIIGDVKVAVKRPKYNMAPQRRKPKEAKPLLATGDAVKSTVNTSDRWRVESVNKDGTCNLRCLNTNGMVSPQVYQNVDPKVLYKV